MYELSVFGSEDKVGMKTDGIGVEIDEIENHGKIESHGTIEIGGKKNAK